MVLYSIKIQFVVSWNQKSRTKLLPPSFYFHQHSCRYFFAILLAGIPFLYLSPSCYFNSLWKHLFSPWSISSRFSLYYPNFLFPIFSTHMQKSINTYSKLSVPATIKSSFLDLLFNFLNLSHFFSFWMEVLFQILEGVFCFVLFFIKVSVETSSVSCWLTSTMKFLKSSIKNLHHLWS